MTFHARLHAALGMLERTGIPRLIYAPPLHRILWMVGVPLRPPHFASTVLNAAWLTPLVMLALLLAAALLESDRGVGRQLWNAGSNGLILGLAFAFRLKQTARELGLPRWEEVERHDQPFGDPPRSPPGWLRD